VLCPPGCVVGLSLYALADALGAEAALSKSTVSRVCQAISEEFTQWSSRRLDDLELDYLFLDASMFKMWVSSRWRNGLSSALQFDPCFAVTLTPLSSLGVLQASEEEPGALPGIANATWGIGFSLGFARAGPMVGSGTDSTFQAASWTCVGIGVVALAFSMALRPTAASSGSSAPAGSTAPQSSP